MTTSNHSRYSPIHPNNNNHMSSANGSRKAPRFHSDTYFGEESLVHVRDVATVFESYKADN